VIKTRQKEISSMSPLQFQKEIRRQEARRLMLGEDLNAASAGHRVGYDDRAYFSHDYKKLFGAPPQQDISRLGNILEVLGLWRIEEIDILWCMIGMEIINYY